MKNKSSKKLLIVSYYLPPTKTVAAVRIFNFHHEAKKHFKEVFSLTTSNRQLFPKDDYPFDDEKTTEVWTWDLRRLLIKNNNTSTGMSQQAKSSRFSQFLSKLSYSFPFNLFLADGGITYILGGFFEGKKIIRAQNIDVIFSSYKPYADHLICFLLKKWNPRLIWIADFRDLHVDEIRQNVFSPKIQKWFNHKILKKADVVTTVSKGLKKNLAELHPNVQVLRNAISSFSKPTSDAKLFSKFTISYTGSIYANLRTAEPLCKAVKSLIENQQIDPEKFQLIYAGNEVAIWQKWVNAYDLNDVSIVHENLPLREAQQIQRQSHINLLLSWATKKQQGVLTAKFYEYLATHNPILLIIKGSRDYEFEAIFRELQAGLVSYDEAESEDQTKNFVLDYYHEWTKNNTITKSIRPEKLAKYRWNTQIQRFLNQEIFR
ncbi:MAG: hypothetical protein AAF573_06370 [Bacteroidota bacterium]